MNKHVMRIIYCMIMGILPLLFSGCAIAQWIWVGQATSAPGLVYRDKQRTFYVGVESTIPGAEIYLNGKNIGRTPDKKVPLTVTYRYSRPRKDLASWYVYEPWHYDGIVESYEIWVRKDGYSSDKKELSFIEPDKPGFKLRDRIFFFEMHPSN